MTALVPYGIVRLSEAKRWPGSIDYLSMFFADHQLEGRMEEERSIVELAVAVTTAWLGNPNTRCTPEEVHAFLKNSHETLAGLSQPVPEAKVDEGEPAAEFKPAVTVRKSQADPEFLISLIDGKPYRALKRHLSGHGLTPGAYRERYGLKADYPMVAPAYAAKRSQLAKQLGLGRKGAAARAGESVAEAAETPVADQATGEKKPRARRVKKAAAAAPNAAEE